MSSWLDKFVPSIVRSESKRATTGTVPEGLWKKCPKCENVLYRPELEKNLDVCPKCNHHLRVGAHLEPEDKLKFKDTKRYKDRIVDAQKKTGEKDALVAMQGVLNGMPVVAVAFEFSFCNLAKALSAKDDILLFEQCYLGNFFWQRFHYWFGVLLFVSVDLCSVML